MFRMALGLGCTAILLAATGCNMCCHPYDHSGPVYSQDGCQSCGHCRAGSILCGNPQPSLALAQPPVKNEKSVLASALPTRFNPSERSAVVDGTSRRMPSGFKAELKPGDVPGSERIISVTERVVKPAAESSQTQMAEDSSPDSSPLPSRGWTARRPTPEVLR
jgi:hypothetical protein